MQDLEFFDYEYNDYFMDDVDTSYFQPEVCN